MIGNRVSNSRRLKDEAEKPFWISFSDLMTALMALFMVVMVVALTRVAEEQNNQQTLVDQRDSDICQFFNRLQGLDRLGYEGIKTDCDNRTISFGEKAQFDSGSHRLSRESAEFIRGFTKGLLDIAKNEERQWLKRLVVEGFTDKTGTSTKLLKDITDIYVNYPSLRPNLLIYLSKIGYTKRSAAKVQEILSTIDVFDDISLFQLASLVTLWEVPLTDDATDFLNSVDNNLVEAAFKSKNPADFYSALWFKAKYSHPENLTSFVKKYQNLWQSDSFLRRQVTAVMSRLLITNREQIDELLRQQISSGVVSTVSLANQIQSFSSIEKLDGKQNFYFFPKSPQRPYPLQKFLVLCSVLNSEAIRINETVRELVLDHIHDPYYKKWLDYQFDIK